MSDRPKTLGDAIRMHIDCLQNGERLTARLAENDRNQAEVYRMIRYALSKPEMNQVAVVDEMTGRVYVLDGDGMVCDFTLRSASDFALDAGEHDTTVSIGEAS